jgi:PAS domain S-box-containing protein
MDTVQAEVVLSTLSEVYALDDVQEVVDRVCRRVVRICPYRLALLSLYFGEDVYVGLEGGDEEMRASFLRSARAATPESRARRRNMIWDRHRIAGTNLCFLPEGSEVPLGPSFHPSAEAPGSEWRPNDRLMVFVRGADNEIRGVLALDCPEDGRRPDPARLGSLETVDRLITLMGVVIHNKHLAAKLRESEERYAAVVEQAHDGILIVRDGRILFANRRFGEMVGTAPPALVNRAASAVLAPEQGATLPGEKEARLLRSDGRAVDVALRTSTIRFGGATAEMVAVADITERKRILKQLVRSQKMARWPAASPTTSTTSSEGSWATQASSRCPSPTGSGPCGTWRRWRRPPTGPPT